MDSSQKSTSDSHGHGTLARRDTGSSRSEYGSNFASGCNVAQDSSQYATLSQHESVGADGPRTPTSPSRAQYSSHIFGSPGSVRGNDQKMEDSGAHEIDEKHQSAASSARNRGKSSVHISEPEVNSRAREERSGSTRMSIVPPGASAQKCKKFPAPDRTQSQSETSCLHQRQFHEIQEQFTIKLNEKEQEVKPLRDRLEDSASVHDRQLQEQLQAHPTIRMYERHFQEQQKQLQANAIMYERQLQDRLQNLLQANTSIYQKQLQEAQEKITKLQHEVDKRGHSIDDLRKHAMAQLASDNSSSFPDDKVEGSFRKLLGDDFDGWIDDNRADKIKDPKAAVQTLQESNVIRPYNLKAAVQLKTMQDSSALYIKALVEGALVRDFCRRFLSNPFFQCPGLFSDRIQKMANTEAFIEWRIHTYEVLGLKRDQKPETFQGYALEFFDANKGILNPPNKDAVEELAGFYKEFASLAQKLWMLKTCIAVEGLEQPSLNKFSDRDMKVHDLIKNGSDSINGKLNGRAVQALVRPRIVSRPLRNKSERGGIVWLQAVVWV